ncbi:MAG: DUF378 domain-containing protein [Candidatus Pacearchaeota archaeon]|nr:DUF378 domain-containing protein [Candidatus Pacearchaeota archaeon]
MAKSVIDVIALILVIIGAINWGLIGLNLGNVVEAIIGTGVVTTIVYILVGVAGLWTIYLAAKK